MVANIEGLAGFTKRNRRSCESFYARRKNTLGPRFQLKQCLTDEVKSQVSGSNYQKIPKKTRVFEKLGFYVQSNFPNTDKATDPVGGGGDYSINFYTARHRLEVLPVTLSYTIFHEKGAPLVYLLLTNGTPFIYLVQNFASL